MLYVKLPPPPSPPQWQPGNDELGLLLVSFSSSILLWHWWHIWQVQVTCKYFIYMDNLLEFNLMSTLCFWAHWKPKCLKPWSCSLIIFHIMLLCCLLKIHRLKLSFTPPSQASFALLGSWPWMAEASSVFKLMSSGWWWAPFCFAIQEPFKSTL